MSNQSKVIVEFNGKQAELDIADRIDYRFGADKAFVRVYMVVRYKTGNKTHFQSVCAYLKNGVFVVPAMAQEWRGRGQRTVFVVGFPPDVAITSKW